MNSLRSFNLYAIFAASILSLLAACGTGSGISPPAPVVRSATLTGAQEVPAVVTAASGTGGVVVDPTTKVITGAVKTTGMTGTAAHIHTGLIGVNGGIIITLTETVAGSGVWNVPVPTVLTQSQYDALLADGLYFNVHSAANPAGEIRGQIVKTQLLSGAQEVPPVTTAASGIGTLAVNHTANGDGNFAIAGGITTTGMTGTAAHIHLGAAGSNGASIVTLAETAAGSGVWVVPATAVLTAAQRTAYLAGNLYFNVHSAANPDGQIRGQIMP